MNATNDESIYQTYLKLCENKPISTAERLMLTKQAGNPPTEKSLAILLRALALMGDPDSETIIAPYLDRVDTPDVAADALLALCRLGFTKKYKCRVLQMSTFDYPNDRRARMVGAALTCMGLYLRAHADLEFAQIISKLASRNDAALLRTRRENAAVISARMAASVAMGADSAKVVDNIALMDFYVSRFLAERGQG